MFGGCRVCACLCRVCLVRAGYVYMCAEYVRWVQGMFLCVQGTFGGCKVCLYVCRVYLVRVVHVFMCVG